MLTVRLLILEDDLRVLSALLNELSMLEDKMFDSCDFAVTVFSEYFQVEDYINKLNKNSFDIILLDRDCKLCGSFHALDIDKFGGDKIITISAVPQWNEDAVKRGVTRVIHKNLDYLDQFALDVIEETERRINTIIVDTTR